MRRVRALTLLLGVLACSETQQTSGLPPGIVVVCVEDTDCPGAAVCDQGAGQCAPGPQRLVDAGVPVPDAGPVERGPKVCVCVLEGGRCVDVASLNFGEVAVGSTARQTVRLTSCGTQQVDLTEVDLEHDVGHLFETAPEFSIERPFAVGVFELGDFSEGVIAYAPGTDADHRGGLRFSISGRSLKSWVPIRGQGAACRPSVVPSRVDLGRVFSGLSTTSQFVLRNIGHADCAVDSIEGPDAPFELRGSSPPFSLSRDALFEVTYTAPLGPQRVESSTVTFRFSSGDVVDVRLLASGGGSGPCELEVQPTGNLQSPISNIDGVLRFDSVNIGFSRTLPIVLRNVGGLDCELRSAALVVQDAGEFSLSAQPLPAVIAPQTEVRIDVTFAPTHGVQGGLAPGQEYTLLRNRVEIEVRGAGLRKTRWEIGIRARPTFPPIDILPAEVTFGGTPYDRPQPPDMRSTCGGLGVTRIYNVGTGPLEVSSIAVDMGSDLFFAIEAVTVSGMAVAPPYMLSVPPGDSAEVVVRHFPTRLAPATHRGLLLIENDVTMLSTVPLIAEAIELAARRDVFTVPAADKVDILWVIDDSGSMSEEQQNLATNFQTFVAEADRLGLDWQAGVTTTEINDSASGKLWACNGFDPIIVGTDPQRGPAFECAVMVTRPPGGNQRPNPGGSDEAEAGLRAARIALEPPVIGVENAGFLRADARLAVVIVSDEEDQSPGPVSVYVDFFRALGRRTTLHVIAGDVPGGCSTAAAAPRYNDAVQQVGGQFVSICSADWSAAILSLGLTGSNNVERSWQLSAPAEPSSIAVLVDGQPLAPGATRWTYDPQSGRVTLFTDLARGAQVTVEYLPACSP